MPCGEMESVYHSSESSNQRGNTRIIPFVSTLAKGPVLDHNNI